MKIFERRTHEYYIEQRIFWIKFRFLNKKGFNLLENMPNLLDGVRYQVSDPNAKNIYRIPKVYDNKKTIQQLVQGGFSLARYGDGEFRCMQGYPIPFQKPNAELSERLKEILANDNKKLLVGIPNYFGATDSRIWADYCSRIRHLVYQYITFDKYYVDACVTRLYGCNPANAENAKKLFSEFKKIWNDKDIIFVEGEESRLGYGNDLFSNARSIKRILCPKVDAYSAYDRIFAVCKKQSKNCLFILALGPTATVLADDLSKIGYRALDLGHLDIEYEWMKMNADHIVPIPSKYTNEAKGGRKVKDVQDEVYLSQIISRINSDK